MGRHERPIDPSAGPLAAFAYDLRELRRAAGSPSYRELARRTHYSDTTLSTAANGTTLPSREVTMAFVQACGGDVDQWRSRWEALRSQLNPPSIPVKVEAPTGTTVDPPPTREEPRLPPSQSRTRARTPPVAVAADDPA